MQIVVLDITARNAVQYNPSLCKALAKQAPNNEILLLSPKLAEKEDGYKYKRLLRIVPNKLESSSGKIKRLLRALEVVLNYIYVVMYVIFKKPDVLHIQWLPFLEFSSLEERVLKTIKQFDKKTKIAFTVHNLYPHDLTDKDEKGAYKKRFKLIARYIDFYLVHLKGTKIKLCEEFNIPLEHIFVTYHGIYKGVKVIEEGIRENNDKIQLIMYGYQTVYKGTDVLINAIQLLGTEQNKNFEVTIVGKTEEKLYDSYSVQAESLGIKWINRFVTDEELYKLIGESDLILLPYREISQSGVLLLALSYLKPIITSDLPSFKETLEGYEDDWYFKNGDPNSLAHILCRFANGEIDRNKMTNVIKSLNTKYSWENTAHSTILAYEKAL